MPWESLGPPMDFLDELQSRVLPADGAMATVLMERGVAREACFEEICASQPDLVRQVHADYLAAGARVLRTNSFGANAIRLAKHGCEHRVGELNWLAAQLAGEVVKGTGARIAASIGPLGLDEKASGAVDRRAIFEEQMGALLDGGARLVCLETFTDLAELLIAVEAKHTLHHCPVIASVVCDRQGRMPDGTLLPDAFAKLRAAEVDVVGVNCGGDPDEIYAALSGCPRDGSISAFPSGGLPQDRSGRLSYPVTPEAFADGALALAEAGVRLIGGCCGIGPKHLAAFTERLATSSIPQ
jgi:methionine synthase / methylenetetrahydrofolate reductase(NADPH)